MIVGILIELAIVYFAEIDLDLRAIHARGGARKVNVRQIVLGSAARGWAPSR